MSAPCDESSTSDYGALLLRVVSIPLNEHKELEAKLGADNLTHATKRHIEEDKLAEKVTADPTANFQTIIQKTKLIFQFLFNLINTSVFT